MKIYYAFIAMLFATATVKAQSKFSADQSRFNTLISQAGLTFKSPLGAVKTPVVKNTEIAYGYALKYPKRNMEIRYLVVPYKGKPVKVMPAGSKVLGTIDTNVIRVFDNYCTKLATNAGGGIKDKNIQTGAFPPDAAKKEFNADRMTFWMIPIKNNSFGTEYKFCNMVAIHKDNVGDAYIFYLANSLQDITTNFKEIGPYNVYYSLRFK
jgi:hypothetical protein